MARRTKKQIEADAKVKLAEKGTHPLPVEPKVEIKPAVVSNTFSEKIAAKKARTQPGTFVGTEKKKLVNDTKVPQCYYDAYGELHKLYPGEKRTIDVVVTVEV